MTPSMLLEGPVMYAPRMDAYLNHWFTSYEEARESLMTTGGYLLPYEDQFLVTVGGAIRELGLDPEDPDWARIGFDWVSPRDTRAWQRLRTKREIAI